MITKEYEVNYLNKSVNIYSGGLSHDKVNVVGQGKTD